MNISPQSNGRAYDINMLLQCIAPNLRARPIFSPPSLPPPAAPRLPPGGGGEGGVAAAASPCQIFCVHTEHLHGNTSTERSVPRDTRRALKQPRGLPSASPSPALSPSSLTSPCHHHLTMPAPARGHAHSRTNAGGTGTLSRLTRSNSHSTRYTPAQQRHFQNPFQFVGGFFKSEKEDHAVQSLRGASPRVAAVASVFERYTRG